MDEKILVRIDEETPSDEKMAIRLVEVKHLNPEFAEKLDILDKKIDALTDIDDGLEALNEIKNLLADFYVSIKTVEANQNKPLQSELNKISELLDVMTNSISDMDTKLVDNKINYSGVRYDIDKVSASLNDIYNSVESLKGVNARDNTEIDDVKNMLHEQNLAINSLGRKSDSVTESIILSSTDREIMEGHVRSELENLQNIITGLSSSGNDELLSKLDGIKKSVATSAARVTKNQTKIDKSIKDFNAYLIRLNSIDYMLRLLQAKNMLKTKKRMPKWARDKKKSIEALIAAIEDEVADIMIVNAIPKTGLDVIVLSKSIGRTRKKTMERLVQLMASGYVDERKVKRKKFYFLVS